MFGRSKKASGSQTKNSKTGSSKKQASQAVVHEFEVEGVKVVLTTKRVKNINMRVKAPDGHVAVSAPPRTSQAYIEAFVRTKLSWIYQRQSEVQASSRVQLSTAERDDLKTQIEPKAQALIAKWEPIMGVQSKNLALRDMTSRWGSCNPKTGRICLNIQLLNYPEECLEYVVVHELCHLLERGHGPRFKALMDTYLPDWKRRRALLR